MTMAAHQLGPAASGAMDASSAAAYHRTAAAAAAWYMDPAARAAGYANSAAAAVDPSQSAAAAAASISPSESHLNHNLGAPPSAAGHPGHPGAPAPPDGSFFASPEASRYYQMHQAYENAAQGMYYVCEARFSQADFYNPVEYGSFVASRYRRPNFYWAKNAILLRAETI